MLGLEERSRGDWAKAVCRGAGRFFRPEKLVLKFLFGSALTSAEESAAGKLRWGFNSSRCREPAETCFGGFASFEGLHL